jgi:hypothetical protein
VWVWGGRAGGRAGSWLGGWAGGQGGGDDALLTKAYVNMGEYYFDRQVPGRAEARMDGARVADGLHAGASMRRRLPTPAEPAPVYVLAVLPSPCCKAYTYACRAGVYRHLRTLGMHKRMLGMHCVYRHRAGVCS